MTEKAGRVRMLLGGDGPGESLLSREMLPLALARALSRHRERATGTRGEKPPGDTGAGVTGGIPRDAVTAPAGPDRDGVTNDAVIGHDVTEQGALRHALERKRRAEALGMLAVGIAHDFNNILQPILINAGLVFDALPEGSPERELLGQIIEAARLGKGITSQIKTFCSGEKGLHGPVAIEPLLQNALRVISRSLPPGVELRQAIGPTPCLAEIAPAQFHQLLANLCINAVQAMEGGPGILTVALAETVVDTPTPAFVSLLNPGDYVKLTVSDTGCGICPEALGHLFDPLYSAGKRSAGTGLGLGVVHAAVRSAGGSVAVSSKPGEGASFEIYLPGQRLAPEGAWAAVHLPEPSAPGLPAGAAGQAMEKVAARGCP